MNEPDPAVPSVAPHEIIATPLPLRFARGWYCLGPSSMFRDGKPHSIEAFGTKLVVFEGEDGHLNVLNAYCRHMGGDLSDGRIVGNTIACPFHDWRWAGDGQCVSVPYARRVPQGARTKAWIAREANKHLVVWYDFEELPPDVDVPQIPEAFNEDWSGNWSWDEAIIESHPRELIDNLIDMTHFYYVHAERQEMPAYFKNVFENEIATQYMEYGSAGQIPPYSRDEHFTGETGQIVGDLRSESSWHGPAYSICYLWWKRPEIGWTQSVQFISILPIEPGKYRLGSGVLTRNQDGLSQEENHRRHVQNCEINWMALNQDVRIWQRKARIDNPLVAEGDGPVYRLRIWYDQFYVDRDQVRPQATARFEKEVDCTYPNTVWAREMADARAQP